MGNFEPSKFGLEFSGFVCAGLISAVFELHWPKGPFLCCSMGDVSAGETAFSGFLEVLKFPRGEADPDGIVDVDLTSGLSADGFSHGRLRSPIPTTDGLVANGVPREPMEAPV
jgi:hypothetical protein